MSVHDILETVQYVVDVHGQQTAVVLDLHAWRALQQLLEDALENESLGELMVAVENDEKLEGVAAEEAYRLYLLEES